MFNQTIITSSYDNIIEANYFTFYYILFILFVSIISLINIINSSIILQQIISSFPDKYVTLSLILFFPIVAIIHMSKSMYVSYYIILLVYIYFFSYRFIIPTLTMPHLDSHLDTHTINQFHRNT